MKNLCPHNIYIYINHILSYYHEGTDTQSGRFFKLGEHSLPSNKIIGFEVCHAQCGRCLGYLNLVGFLDAAQEQAPDLGCLM